MDGALLVFLLMISGLYIFFYLTKGTYIQLDFRRGGVWPLLIYRELFTIFSALILVLMYGVDAFEESIVNAREENVFNIVAISIYAVSAFLATIAFIAKRLKVPVISVELSTTVDEAKIRRFANAAALTGLLLLSIALVFLDFQHAFVSAIISGGDLVAVRLHNVYGAKLPTQLGQVVNISWWIISIYVGYLLYKKKTSMSIIYIVMGVFLASAHGDKAPVMMFFVVGGLSFLSFNGLNISTRFLLKLIILQMPVMYLLLFFVVSLQIPDLGFGSFNVYLLNRLGVGQMAGVFETLSIPRLEDDFFWHMIPGASFFVEYVPYDKALMMVTEGYGLTEMGVKNSLFISEAYGIGGTWLLIFSPFIVGVSYCLGILILSQFLKSFFCHTISAVFTLPLFILSSSLTGGFSSFPLFKGLILQLACLGLIWIAYGFLRISWIGNNKSF